MSCRPPTRPSFPRQAPPQVDGAELASHLVDLIADPVSRLLDGPVSPVPISIRWHDKPSRSPCPKRYTFSRSGGAGTLGVPFVGRAGAPASSRKPLVCLVRAKPPNAQRATVVGLYRRKVTTTE